MYNVEVMLCPFLQTEGRQLPLEKIILGNTQFQSSPQADWGQQAVKEQVITPVPLRNWLVLFVNRDKSKAIEFMNMMKKVTPPMGIQVRNPQPSSTLVQVHQSFTQPNTSLSYSIYFLQVNDARPVELPNDRTETYLRNIREQLTPETQMVVIIFPTSRDDRYSAVKKLCCVESPVPSQVTIYALSIAFFVQSTQPNFTANFAMFADLCVFKLGSPATICCRDCLKSHQALH